MCGHANETLFTFCLSSFSRYVNGIENLGFGALLRDSLAILTSLLNAAHLWVMRT